MAKADEKNSAEYARQKAAGYLLSPETRRVIDEKTRLLDNAEKGIQAILLALENDHGIKVAHVDVDTRNFGNYRVEITATA